MEGLSVLEYWLSSNFSYSEMVGIVVAAAVGLFAWGLMLVSAGVLFQIVPIMASLPSALLLSANNDNC